MKPRRNARASASTRDKTTSRHGGDICPPCPPCPPCGCVQTEAGCRGIARSERANGGAPLRSVAIATAPVAFLVADEGSGCSSGTCSSPSATRSSPAPSKGRSPPAAPGLPSSPYPVTAPCRAPRSLPRSPPLASCRAPRSRRPPLSPPPRSPPGTAILVHQAQWGLARADLPGPVPYRRPGPNPERGPCWAGLPRAWGREPGPGPAG